MKRIIVYTAIATLTCATVVKKRGLVREAFAHAEEQTRVMLNEIKNQQQSLRGSTDGSALVAPRTIKSNTLMLVPSRDWTSGFFSGTLWYLYEYTGKKEWLEFAKNFTALMEAEKWNGKTHDMGFKMYCSYGNAYRLTADAVSKDILLQSAKTLCTRFNPLIGAIRSWDHNRDKWDFPVIIDNMMNLELLFFATRVTGDSSFYKIAVRHAKTTLANHFREDYSAYHVVDYDTLTGKVRKKNTHQGYSHESAWSRGQAWALYGYTMCYRETGEDVFLHQAEKIAAFIFSHPNLPDDLIPYWDYNAPGIPNEPRDASAAAITASALYELSTYAKTERKNFKRKADTILQNLAKYYASPIGEYKGFVLLHSTGSKPANSEVDVPLCYADYYYLEALLRKQKLADDKYFKFGV